MRNKICSRLAEQACFLVSCHTAGGVKHHDLRGLSLVTAAVLLAPDRTKEEPAARLLTSTRTHQEDTAALQRKGREREALTWKILPLLNMYGSCWPTWI